MPRDRARAHNIQVNSLLPDGSTDMTDWIRNWPEWPRTQEMIQRTPRGVSASRMNWRARRLSRIQRFQSMTGAELVIDGGFSVR